MPERLSPPSFEPDTVLCGGVYQLDPPSCHLLREGCFGLATLQVKNHNLVAHQITRLLIVI
jgi:hypothetical protein